MDPTSFSPVSSELIRIFLHLPWAPLMGGPQDGCMPGSTFRTSRTERLRRRTDGPSFTLIVGAADRSRTTHRESSPAHPAQEGFTPDGIPGDARDTAVQDSEPGSSPFRSVSRGNASLDSEGMSTTGSGPIVAAEPLVSRPQPQPSARLVRRASARTDHDARHLPPTVRMRP